MKILKNVITGIAVLMLLLLLISFFLPSSIHIEREMVIETPVEVVFDQVNDFRNWEYWSPWEKIDPAMINRYAGPSQGVGHKHIWMSTHDRVESGTEEIVESVPGQSIRIQVQLSDGGGGESVWTFKEIDAGTLICWSMNADVGSDPINRYSGLLLDALVGPLFEQGLADMRDHARFTYTSRMTEWFPETGSASDTLRGNITGL